MNECFQTSLDHLLAQLGRIELKLRLLVMEMRYNSSQVEEDRFRGLYIPEKEIDTVLTSTPFQQGDNLAYREDPAVVTLVQSLEHLEANIAEREKESLRCGLILRLHELGWLFSLSKFDMDVLLVCLLPELNLKHQRLYAYLQNDVTKKSPNVDLVVRLLCKSFEDRLRARERFSPEESLIKHHILRLCDEHLQSSTPLLGKSLHINERITSYLLGGDEIDARLQTFANLTRPGLKLEDVILPEDTENHLIQLVTHFKREPLICYFQGSYGVGKQTTAEAMCFELGVRLLSIDVDGMLAADIPLELAVPLIFREGRLQNAALYLENYNILLNEEREFRLANDRVIKELESYPQWVFLAGEGTWQPKDILHNKPLIYIEFPAPTYSARKQLWEKYGNHQSPVAPDVNFTDISGKFRLNGGQIGDAMATARSLALWRDPENGLVTTHDLYSACRQQSNQRLNTLASKIHPRHNWDDIILPRDQKEQLQEICSYVEHYHTVYGDWGFGQKLSRSTGLNALFAGPSGTGKTMAAEIMANELGLDLYKIDLSAIVSKYIGETEKNLDRIFREGQTANAILFFDEADALFGKRSEVRDSHDRYANIEVAYLLQKMEEYDGVVILATNLRKNMDEAFARRMHFTLEFPIPEETDRYRIWQSIFPGVAPLTKDIDLLFLARQFKITGGNIRNIALGAAFLAVETSGYITMKHLIRATKREYQKMGKLCTEGDFAQYFELVKG